MFPYFSGFLNSLCLWSPRFSSYSCQFNSIFNIFSNIILFRMLKFFKGESYSLYLVFHTVRYISIIISFQLMSILDKAAFKLKQQNDGTIRNLFPFKLIIPTFKNSCLTSWWTSTNSASTYAASCVYLFFRKNNFLCANKIYEFISLKWIFVLCLYNTENEVNLSNDRNT